MDKSITDVEQVIRGYLHKTLHMSLATCSDNKPWVCEVHFVFDDALNLYFRSKPTRRHSLEIESNPSVAGNIVVQHTVNQEVRGVYFEGAASVLTVTKDVESVYPLFVSRLQTEAEILVDATKEDGHKFYRINVSKFYLFDSRESSPARKYELTWH